jgi:hypothetical protein
VSESIKGRPKNYRVFGDYFREGRIKKRWSTFRLKMPVYHVTLQTLIRTIVRNGFVLEDLVEARAIKAGRKIDPASYKAYSRIPYFYVFKVRKI